MANRKLSCPMLQGGLSVNLNHLKTTYLQFLKTSGKTKLNILFLLFDI